MQDELALPVTYLDSEDRQQPVEEGTGLCLSGGGYRAMLFHAGALWRIFEARKLSSLARISSVSGGSITAAVLAAGWGQLNVEHAPSRDDFLRHLVAPIRGLARRTVDTPSIIKGLVLPGPAAEWLAKAYDRYVFRGKTLQDLPDKPRFVINATNLQSGVLWRFMRPYMRDWRVGEIKSPRTSLARAVAASSASPPVLSPLTLKLDPKCFVPNSGQNLQHAPFTSEAVLTDGGVYDNLGLETVFKRYRTVLVSNAGQSLQPAAKPHTDWVRQSIRVGDVTDNQVRSLRTRQLIGTYRAGLRDGAYWGIATNIANYGLSDSLPCPYERTLELAEVETRLAKLSEELQERLINWGYAVCDAALRAHYDHSIRPPSDFPYPSARV